ncbi:ABC transporter substrate-binding protein [Streptomyces sp. 8P21H-1]|uniref:ABC transporter substrate-binding protein n=1 Tax=Streptomyces sp. 8P21H-1 TaxID=2737048 RepID=UPI00156F7AF9|nr:ABC transporter substrate-binding protein [Streptomyces sp. 8P21H-1]NSL42693.1 carbohydrate ABC transporter substrate-binding protein [Streptomyces sp. 8P21H-1]
MRKNTNSRPRAMTRPVRRRPLLATAGSLTAAVSLLLQGCGSGSDGGSGDGRVELTFFNQSRGQEAALNALAKKYTRETGVVIKVDSPGPSDYLAKLQAKAQSRNMPDIYSSFLATDMAPFYKAGWAMDLQDELKGEWGEEFAPGAVQEAAFTKGNNLDVPPGIYSVHWETQAYGFIYDPKATAIDPKAPSKTMDDFIAALKKSNKDGKGNFAVAASLTPQLIPYLASNWLTDQQIDNTYAGKASWKADGWRKAFQSLLELKKAGLISNGTLPGGNGDNPAIESAFFIKRDVGAIFDSSAGVSVGNRTAPNYKDFASMGIPAAADATYKPRTPGFPGKGAVINPRGDHSKEALAFVKWLTEPAQQKVFADEARIVPTSKKLLADGSLPAQLSGFAETAKKKQKVTNSLTGDVNDMIIRDSQSLVLGEKTVDQVLDDLQSAQERS